jgi:hypothetical protein
MKTTNSNTQAIAPSSDSKVSRALSMMVNASSDGRKLLYPIGRTGRDCLPHYLPSTRSRTTPCEGTSAENSAPAVSSV